MTEEIKAPTLTKIQAELKVPKDQYNSFAKYNFRNAEGIMKAVKPLLLKYGAALHVEESFEQLGNMIIVVETLIHTDAEHPQGQEIRVKGHSPLSQHKEMSQEQDWGTASSYATKYALGKLFLIDDSQDVDSMDNRGQGQPQRRQYGNRQTPQQAQAHSNANNNFAQYRELKGRAKQEMVGGKSFLELYQEYLQQGNKGQAQKEISQWMNADQTGSRKAFIEEFIQFKAWE